MNMACHNEETIGSTSLCTGLVNSYTLDNLVIVTLWRPARILKGVDMC